MVPSLTFIAVAVLATVGSSHGALSEKAEWGDYPYLVTFRVNENYCAGSVIGDKWILTSSSCIISPRNDMYLEAGRVSDYTNYAPSVEIELKKEQLFSHEKFNPTTFENNIGLIKLHEGLNFSRYLNTIPIGNMGLQPGGIIVGWGDWDGDFTDYGGIKYSSVTFSASTACQSHLNQYNCSINDHIDIDIYKMSTANVYCTATDGPISHLGYTNLNGGPVIMEHSPGMPMQIGVLSWATELGWDDEKPGGLCSNLSAILVYTDVSPYIDWINDVRSRNTASYSGLSFVLIAFSLVSSSLF